MLDYIANNWLDLLLTLVGLSAFAVYYIEKYDKKRTAATLVINQIDEIDEQLSALKHEPQLNGQVIYNAKTVIDQNVWEQYKHLFAKTLDKSEYELIQKFFDNAERVERVRLELVDMIVTAWHDKSAVTHETISNMIIKHKDNPATMEAEINTYRTYLGRIDTGFTADVSIQLLAAGLNNYYPVVGTTAYKKIKKYSFNK